MSDFQTIDAQINIPDQFYIQVSEQNLFFTQSTECAVNTNLFVLIVPFLE